MLKDTDILEGWLETAENCLVSQKYREDNFVLETLLKPPYLTLYSENL